MNNSESVKNLTAKLVKVMAETKRVAKNGRNEFHKYDYVTESDVLEAVRDVLVKHNIFIYSSVIGTDKNQDMTSVVMEHTLVDSDSGEFMKVKSFGQGQDKGDKGGNKAVTASTKYFLMKNLLLPTGDDPEATDETGKSTGPKAVKLATNTLDTNNADNPIAAPKKYGFSGKPKAIAATPTETVKLNVAGADEF